MIEFMRRLNELFFRFKLYVFGVRFYKRVLNTETPKVFESTYHIGSKFIVHFKLNRMSCMDLVLRRGSIVSEAYHSYEITARFEGEVPNSLHQLDDQSFFFNGRVNSFGKEEQTLDLIAEIYLDFIKTRYVTNY